MRILHILIVHHIPYIYKDLVNSLLVLHFAVYFKVNNIIETHTDCGSVRICRCTTSGLECQLSCPPELCSATEMPIQDNRGCCQCQSITTTTPPPGKFVV